AKPFFAATRAQYSTNSLPILESNIPRRYWVARTMCDSDQTSNEQRLTPLGSRQRTGRPAGASAWHIHYVLIVSRDSFSLHLFAFALCSLPEIHLPTSVAAFRSDVQVRARD